MGSQTLAHESAPAAADPAFIVERLGVVMEPEPGNAAEVQGVLNPATCRGPDGALYLFPRLVAEGNYSRIGRARVRFDGRGNPVGVERLGVVLEPAAPYERNRRGGGCEDPRVTYIARLQRYVMTYVANGDEGPRVAVAVSEDTVTWRRLGELHFGRARVDFNGYGNKDASYFPEPVLDPNGEPAFAIIHRPTYKQHFPDGSWRDVLPPQITDPRESIWISYVNLTRALEDECYLTHVHENHLLMAPEAPWEQVKLGGGAPPFVIPQGWFLLYHGIRPVAGPDGQPAPRGQYCAGAALLDRQRPWHVLYRSPEPLLAPDEECEQRGIVTNVVFPTGVDIRADLGPGVVDIYYGMADYRIGAARLRIPANLPRRLRDQQAGHPHGRPAPADVGHPNAPTLVPGNGHHG